MLLCMHIFGWNFEHFSKQKSFSSSNKGRFWPPIVYIMFYDHQITLLLVDSYRVSLNARQPQAH